MTTPARRRLMRDFKKLQDDPPAGVGAAPTEDNIMVWEAVIFGPQETPFEDGTFRLSLQFTEEYPNKPPTVKFTSKMFHPNVYADGSICLDILQNQWSPTYDVAAILTSIQSLLDEPNPNSPANSLAAQLYQENRREYEKRVQQIVEQSWMAFSDDEDGESKGEDKGKKSVATSELRQQQENTANAASSSSATSSAAMFASQQQEGAEILAVPSILHQNQDPLHNQQQILMEVEEIVVPAPMVNSEDDEDSSCTPSDQEHRASTLDESSSASSSTSSTSSTSSSSCSNEE